VGIAFTVAILIRLIWTSRARHYRREEAGAVEANERKVSAKAAHIQRRIDAEMQARDDLSARSFVPETPNTIETFTGLPGPSVTAPSSSGWTRAAPLQDPGGIRARKKLARARVTPKTPRGKKK
jgi:hypothetical protein